MLSGPTPLPPGSFPFAHNFRTYVDGVYEPRGGLTRIWQVAGAVHSIFRLNDGTPLAGVPAVRVIGAGTHVYVGALSDIAPFDLGGGWSGHPLCAHMAQPPQSAQPWIYLADAAQLRKVNVNKVMYQTGIAPPALPPGVELAQMGLTTISRLNTSAGWNLAGTSAGAPSTIARVNTTIAIIVYDAGVTGYATVSLADLSNITEGTLLDVGGAETALVTGVTVPVAATTIGAILYDSGLTGFCTIQPTASLGTGQLEAPPLAAYRDRAGYAVPRGQAGLIPLEPNPGVGGIARIRQVDFPVNALVTIAGAETVRIVSIAVGQDGIQSFRCKTTGSYAAGATLAGVGGIRLFLVGTYTPGATVTTNAVRNIITPTIPSGAPNAAVTGGIQSVLAANLAQVGGRATLEDDILHLCIRVDRLAEVSTVRLYFDIDRSVNNFLQNYRFFEWRASDIIAAIQTTNAAAVSSVLGARATTVTNTQINAPVSPNTAVPRGTTPPVTTAPTATVETRATPAELQSFLAGGDATALDATSSQLAFGNNQWVDLKCRITDLIAGGTDFLETLANVAAVEVLISATATAPLTVDYNALWLGGGFGADVGDTGNPYVYRSRFRSTVTGVISNWSPPSAGGVIPRRQRVLVNSVGTTDPQVNKVDFARFGGALPVWTYVGSQDYAPAVSYDDDYADDAIVGGETIVFDNFQPWPTADIPHTGTCNIAGNAVQWVSGDQFNPAWAPGSIIFLNGLACTLFASPSPTFLQVNENAGSGLGVSFYLPDATLQGQPLPTVWGHVGDEVHFACGDPKNPATLYWTNAGGLDTASDANTLDVSEGEASEPLQNGFVWDGAPYVFSCDDLYRIVPTPGSVSPFRADRTACGKGLWTRTAFAVSPQGTFFLTDDGIALTAGGTPAQMVTTDEMRRLFPKDGIPGEAVTIGAVTIQPPDMTQTDDLRLTVVDDFLYFDYVDVFGNSFTLVLDIVQGVWLLDQYAVGIRSRFLEPGVGVHSHLLGGATGKLYQALGATDDGVPITWLWATAPTAHGVPGYLSVRDVMIAYQAQAPVVMTVAYDGRANAYTLPPSAGIYARDYGPLVADKGKSVIYGISSALPVRIFKPDCAVRVQGWGIPGGYQIVSPFGGPSRKDGAVV